MPEVNRIVLSLAISFGVQPRAREKRIFFQTPMFNPDMYVFQAGMLQEAPSTHAESAPKFSFFMLSFALAFGPDSA
jgi:hypothetical protein